MISSLNGDEMYMKKAEKLIRKLGVKLPYKNPTSDTILNAFEAIVKNLEEGKIKITIQKNLDRFYSLFEQSLNVTAGVGDKDFSSRGNQQHKLEDSSLYTLPDSFKINSMLESNPTFNQNLPLQCLIGNLRNMLSSAGINPIAGRYFSEHVSFLLNAKIEDLFPIDYPIILSRLAVRNISVYQQSWDTQPVEMACILGYTIVATLLTDLDSLANLGICLPLILSDCEDYVHLVMMYIGYWGFKAKNLPNFLISNASQNAFDGIVSMLIRNREEVSDFPASVRSDFYIASLLILSWRLPDVSDLKLRQDSALAIMTSFCSKLVGRKESIQAFVSDCLGKVTKHPEFLYPLSHDQTNCKRQQIFSDIFLNLALKEGLAQSCMKYATGLVVPAGIPREIVLAEDALVDERDVVEHLKHHREADADVSNLENGDENTLEVSFCIDSRPDFSILNKLDEIADDLDESVAKSTVVPKKRSRHVDSVTSEGNNKNSNKKSKSLNEGQKKKSKN